MLGEKVGEKVVLLRKVGVKVGEKVGGEQTPFAQQSWDKSWGYYSFWSKTRELENTHKYRIFNAFWTDF